MVDAGCAGCSVSFDGSGTLTAHIQGGKDTLDTAYGLKDLGASGLTGRVYVRTLVGLAAGQVLKKNLSVFQVRDVADALVYELYIAHNRTLKLWSPAGGLRSSSINVSTSITVPKDGTSTIRVEVSALANSSVTVRVDGVDRISVTGLKNATTGNQRYLHAGIDHYDGTTTNEPVGAFHASVAYSQTDWLGAPATSPPASGTLPVTTTLPATSRFQPPPCRPLRRRRTAPRR